MKAWEFLYNRGGRFCPTGERPSGEIDRTFFDKYLRYNRLQISPVSHEAQSTRFI